MPKINSIDVVDRNNRPGVISKVMLRTYFFNDGNLQDPVAVSSVGVYQAARNQSPCSIFDTDNQVTANPLMGFANSSVDVTDSVFDSSNYGAPFANASGIYKLGTGQYAVVLDGTVDLSGQDLSGAVLENCASAVDNYIDVWWVAFTSGTYQALINNFTLFDDTFYAVTEKLLFNVNVRDYRPVRMRLGSTEDIRLFTEITVQNRNVDESLKNLFRTSLITDPAIQIKKINRRPGVLPAEVTVSSYANTSSLIETTSDNTIVLSWNTNDLLTHASTLNGDMGGPRGEFEVQAKFNILDSTIITPPMPIVVY